MLKYKMNKAIFIIDIWKYHFCDYVNDFVNKNINKINNHIEKFRKKNYLIIFLNTGKNIKSNYNKLYNYKINDKIAMKPPFSSNLCYCNINIPCYFKLHEPCDKQIHEYMYNEIIKSKKMTKKHHIKKFTKDLEKKKLVKNNSDIYINEEFHPKLIIKDQDYLIDDKTEVLLSLLKEKCIKEVYYMGEATNLCISFSRNISANKLISNDFNCYIIEDLSSDFGYIGFNFEETKIDSKIDYNYCHEEIKKYLESYDIKYINSKQILD